MVTSKTLSKCIEEINEELKAIYDRPVIKLEHGKYDTENGRMAVSLNLVVDKLAEKLGVETNLFRISGYNIIINDKIVIKTKHRAPGLLDWDALITIIQLYCEQQEYLDNPFNQILSEIEFSKNELIKKNELKENLIASDFQEKLKNYGITINEFLSLKQEYEFFTFPVKSKLQAK
jgi:hypothetical protein